MNFWGCSARFNFAGYEHRSKTLQTWVKMCNQSGLTDMGPSVFLNQAMNIQAFQAGRNQGVESVRLEAQAVVQSMQAQMAAAGPVLLMQATPMDM